MASGAPRAGRSRRRPGRGLSGDARRGGAAAHGRRRAVRRVPVGRHRQLGHRRADEPPQRPCRSTPFRSGSTRRSTASSDYARQVATRFKTNHHELIVAPEDIIDRLPEAIGFRDAPVAETADVPIWMLSQEAAKSVKMVLSGEGSDEILAGYPKHKYEPYVAMYQRLVPALLHDRLIEPLVDMLPYGLLPGAHPGPQLWPARPDGAAAALVRRASTSPSATNWWRSMSSRGRSTPGRSRRASAKARCAACCISTRPRGCRTICWSAATA